MNENIKFYPKAYIMSDNLKLFFTAVTNDTELQEQLYATKKLSDVAIIANKLGFNVTAAEVLKAQAGRVLAIIAEQPDDVKNLLCGMQPLTGAQWGRGGGGYLDRVGFWLNELSATVSSIENEVEIKKFLDKSSQDVELKKRLLSSTTFNDLAALIQDSGFTLTAIDLLSYQAQKILALSNIDAEIVADN